MKMNRMHNIQRLLAVVMLVVMLIPILALSAYASDIVGYYFSYDYAGETEPRRAWKDEKGQSAGANIVNAQFNGGSVYFQLQRWNGSELSYESGPYTETGNKPLYYYADVDLSKVSKDNQMQVQLASTATSAVDWISGRFQP